MWLLLSSTYCVGPVLQYQYACQHGGMSLLGIYLKVKNSCSIFSMHVILLVHVGILPGKEGLADLLALPIQRSIWEKLIKQ